MSKVGYYRLKLSNLTAGKITKRFYVNGVLASTHTVDVKQTCGDWRQLKWLDKNGQYRFYPFLAEYSIKDTPKSLGATSNFITSLLNSQTDARSLGNSNERTLTLRAINVTASERLLLSELFTSPMVQLYTGDFTEDNQSQYIQVEVKGDGIVKNEKNRNGKFEITVNLPKHYTINRL